MLSPAKLGACIRGLARNIRRRPLGQQFWTFLQIISDHLQPRTSTTVGNRSAKLISSEMKWWKWNPRSSLSVVNVRKREQVESERSAKELKYFPWTNKHGRTSVELNIHSDTILNKYELIIILVPFKSKATRRTRFNIVDLKNENAKCKNNSGINRGVVRR